VTRRGLILALLFTAACQPAPKSDRDREIINFHSTESGKKTKGAITERELRAELARLRFEREGLSLRAAPLPAELKSAAIDRMIERRVLLLEAERLGVKASTTAAARELDALRQQMGEPELQRKLLSTLQTEEDLLRVFSDRLTVGKLLAEVAHAGIKVTPDEIDAAWAALPDAEKSMPARVRASQIVVITEEEGKQVLDELKKKKPFEEVAARHSIGPEVERGGDLGWIEPASMPDGFQSLLTMEVGKVSGLVSSEYGFHVFKLVAREEARPRTLDETRAALESKILRAKLENAERDYVAKVMSHHKVETNKRALARIE